jgi:hypothetical protein
LGRKKGQKSRQDGKSFPELLSRALRRRDGQRIAEVAAGRNRRSIGRMRYHVLLECDRPDPTYLGAIDADDDEEARRLVAETWPGERLRIVRQDDDRLVWLSDGAVVWFPF